MPYRGPVARILLGIGLVCGGLLALAGALVIGPSGIVAVAVAGGVSAALAAGVVRETPRGNRAVVRESAVRAGGGTVAALLLVAGTAAVAGGVVAAVVTALAVASGLGWWLLNGRRSARSGVQRPATGSTFRSVTPFTPPVVRRSAAPSPGSGPVSALPTSVLGTEWLRTSAALARRLDPGTRHTIVRRRAEVLIELERRDPAGFSRWLAAGASSDSDPAPFVRGTLRGDQAAGTDAA